MKSNDLDKIVLTYLHKKGYKDSSNALVKEAGVVSSIDDMAFSAKVDAETNLKNQILLYNPNENEPSVYLESYQRLKAWCEDSLDLYKNELEICRYPIFIHCYLDLVERGFQSTAVNFMQLFRSDHADAHEAEIQRLSAVVTPQHMKENELVGIFRKNKFNIKMCSYASELLLSFLQNNKLMSLLSIVNQYLNIQIYHGQPGSSSSGTPGLMDETTSYGAMTGEPIQAVTSLNSKSVLWGAIDPSDYISTGSTAKLPNAPAPNTDASVKGNGASGKESAANAPPLMRIPLPVPKEAEVEMRTKALREARQRVTLSVGGSSGGGVSSSSNAGSAGGGTAASSVTGGGASVSGLVGNTAVGGSSAGAAASAVGAVGSGVVAGLNAAQQMGSVLPSVCMYTFLNSRDRVNCIDISNDSTLVCAGFSESFIRCWSLTGEYLKGLKRGMELSQFNPMDEDINLKITDEGSASHYKTLYGHSGSVFSTDFSPDNQFILSGSEDTTVRLWSTRTWSNLVCYRGHNYPVWDVDFSPFGFYFASASHDKTARFWSSDRIYPLRIFAGHLSDVECVKFHPNSNYVATGSSDKTCRLWDVQTGECVRIFTGHSKAVSCLAISPDGKYMASGSFDNTVRLWDLGSGKPVACYTGHGPSSVHAPPPPQASSSSAPASSHAGKDVQSAVPSSDASSVAARMSSYCNGVYSVDFSGEGSVLASGGADCTVRIWDVKGAVSSSKSAVSAASGASRGPMGGAPALTDGANSMYPGPHHVVTFPTKNTPVFNVQFTRQNVLLSSGVFKAPPVIGTANESRSSTSSTMPGSKGEGKG